MFVRFTFVITFLLSVQLLISQSIFDLNRDLGKGINMGNMFEAPTETAWGNPFQEDYFSRIAALGFDHVRIPIRWDTPSRTMQTSPFIIDPTFLERIQSVVDNALSNDLHVIINMHHHEEIFMQPDEVKPRFLSQWMQIAELFENYDDRLLFEVLNEPNTNLTPDKWNLFFAEALTTIRMSNPTRAVLMGVANWGGLGSISDLIIPDDGNIILSIHYYEPFQFTHQGAEWVEANSQEWLGTKWENTSLEREEIEMQFQFAKAFATEQNIPIHIGEFGAYSRADLDSRVKWTNFLARWFEEQGFSWAYWEFSAGFGIFDPSTGQYLQPLADALLTNPMSPPVEVNTAIVFESDFSENDTDWNFGVQPQAAGTYSTADGVAEISVTQNSDNWWHVQLVKNGISIKEGSRYLVSFEAAAGESAGFTTYIGRASGDFGAYSGYKTFTATEDFTEFTYTFAMMSPDDPMARGAFDFASTATTFYIRNFVIEEIIDDSTSSTYENDDPEVMIFPNPAKDLIQLTGIKDYNRFRLVDALGRQLLVGELKAESVKTIEINSLNANMLYLILESEKRAISRKIVRLL